MCIKNGVYIVLFSGHSFIDFQGVALSAPPRENQPLPDVGFERVKVVVTPNYSVILSYNPIISDEYFVSNIEKVDSVTLLRKDKLLTGVTWTLRFQHALTVWPCLNDLG